MSVETEPIQTKTSDAPQSAPSTNGRRKGKGPRLSWSRLLWLVGGTLLFLGLLALAILAVQASPNGAASPTRANTPLASGTSAAAIPISGAAQHINSLVADPADFQNLFAATDKGVLASSDGGKTWNDVSDGLNGASITTLALDGNDPERPVYAGTNGAGLFKSSDGGKTWNNLGLNGRDIVTLAANQGHLYVGVNGTLATLYASADAGKTFTVPDSNQLPPRLDIRSIAIDPVNPALVYIGTAPISGLHFPDLGRVKSSSDGGKTWNDLGKWQNTASAGLDSQDVVAVLLAVSSSRIYAGDGHTLFRLSPDQSAWQAIAGGLPLNGTLDVTSDPQIPTVIYAYGTDGFYRSSDGQSWAKISAGNKAALLPDAKPALSTPALIAANTHSNAISVNNLNSTFLYALDTNGNLISFENRDFGDNKLAPLPGGPPLPDFSAYGGIDPADPVAPPTNANDTSRIYFKETGHFISGGFYDYWHQNGGLETFGLPLTEEFADFDAPNHVTRTVQYFERAKFEYHSELPTNQRVQLALLGHEAIAGKYYVPGRFIPTNSTQSYYTATSHTLRGAFYQFWVKNGGLGRFGLPLTEAVPETQTDGRKITVQYFERAKLELDSSGTVQIGLLGRQVLVQKGWLKK